MDDPNKLVNEIIQKNVPKSDEIRTLICDLGDPFYAYQYAKNIDKKPTDETRAAVQRHSTWKKDYKNWENDVK